MRNLLNDVNENIPFITERDIARQQKICYIVDREIHRAKGGFAPLIFSEGSSSSPDERKEGDAMYVTYQDLIQIGILVVALANLIYQIYKGKKKQPPLFAVVTAYLV